MRGCPYDENPDKRCPILPIENDYATIREPCGIGQFGRNCGGIAAQQLLMQTFDFDTTTFDLDTRYGEINASARVRITPEGEAPDEIKSQLVGLSLPLRINRPFVRKKVPVVHADLALTLLNDGRVEAANWYNDRLRAALQAGKILTYWHFNKTEVVVSKLSEPHDSLTEYDRSFWKSNPALWNSFMPPLFYARAARGEVVLPQTVPISLPETPLKTRLLKKRRSRPRISVPATKPAGRTIEDVELPE